MFSALRMGFSDMLANKRMVLVFYLTNLIFGIVMVLPFRAILSEYIGNSMMGESLAGRLDIYFLGEFLMNNNQVFDVFALLVLMVPILYWLSVIFLSGGALTVFRRGETYKPASFWGGAAQYFGKFFRLALWCLPIGLAFFCLQFLASILERVIGGSDPYQNVPYWFGWIKMGLRYIGIILFVILFDYARIHAVTTSETKMRLSMWQALKFMFRHFFRTFGLALALFLIGATVLAVYNPISDSLAAPNAVVILVLFLLQQLYMIARMILKMTAFSSQLHLFDDLAGEEELIADEEIGLEGAPA